MMRRYPSQKATIKINLINDFHRLRIIVLHLRPLSRQIEYAYLSKILQGGIGRMVDLIQR